MAYKRAFKNVDTYRNGETVMVQFNDVYMGSDRFCSVAIEIDNVKVIVDNKREGTVISFTYDSWVDSIKSCLVRINNTRGVEVFVPTIKDLDDWGAWLDSEKTRLIAEFENQSRPRYVNPWKNKTQ